MLRKVKLYGQLAKFVGHRVLEADVHSAAEAIRFLLANWPELEAHMSDQYYKISAGEWEITEEELGHPTGASDIEIVPVVGGAGGKGWGKVLLGAVIIGAAFAVGAGVFGAALAKNLGAIAFAKGIGASLLLGGVAEILTPIPKLPESTQDPQNSFSFSGTQNTSRAGVPIPICYGKIITGSIVISAAIDTVQVEA